MLLFGSTESQGGFQMMGPFPVNETSLTELFRYLRALGRKPLAADALAEAFGPHSPVATAVVRAFYQVLADGLPDRAETLYRQWEGVFGVVYGEETSRAQRDVPELAAGYGLPADAGLKWALFARSYLFRSD